MPIAPWSFTDNVRAIAKDADASRRPAPPSRLQPHLEPAMDQSLAVERHISLETGVGHDLLVDCVALHPGSVDNPGEDDDLVVLRLHGAGKRGQRAVWHIVADALHDGERTMLFPDFAGFAGKRLVGFNLVLGHRNHETIDIWHGNPSLSANFDPRTIHRTEIRHRDDKIEIFVTPKVRPIVLTDLGLTRNLGRVRPAPRRGQSAPLERAPIKLNHAPRHARACRGHPRLNASARTKAWMAGT